MAKVKEKQHVKRDKTKIATVSDPSGTTAEAATAMYADGTPLDRVQYLEAKLILKPDRFTSVQAFRDFGKIMQRTAKKVGVGFIEDREAGLRPEVREILFGDTPDFRLYNNAFILRRRISYVDGFPVGDPEIVFKFRHPDERKATALDVRPKIAGKYRIKFKAEALPLKDQVGGYRILYSHNCQLGLSQMHDADETSMATLVKVFPALAVIKKSDDEKISLVNEGIVEEVLLPLGNLDFGNGIIAKCDIGLWRNRGEHKSLVGEFAFQVKFDRREAIAEKRKKLAAQFYITLQRDVEDWLALGVTNPARNMMMIVAIGQWAGGLLGALIVLIAFFGPTALLAFIVARGWKKLEKWPWRTSIQQGLAPVSIGLLRAGCFTMAKGAISGVETAAIAVGVLLILVQYKINPGLLVLAGAALGVFSFMPK